MDDQLKGETTTERESESALIEPGWISTISAISWLFVLAGIAARMMGYRFPSHLGAFLVVVVMPVLGMIGWIVVFVVRRRLRRKA